MHCSQQTTVCQVAISLSGLTKFHVSPSTKVPFSSFAFGQNRFWFSFPPQNKRSLASFVRFAFSTLKVQVVFSKWLCILSPNPPTVIIWVFKVIIMIVVIIIMIAFVISQAGSCHVMYKLNILYITWPCIKYYILTDHNMVFPGWLCWSSSLRSLPKCERNL